MLAVVILILVTWLACFWLKKSFGKMLPITMMGIPVVLFVSQFVFRTFSVGVWAVGLTAVAGAGVTIWRLMKGDKEFRRQIFSKGFFIFLVLVVLIVISDWQRELSVWDELAHWGTMVKEMLRLDQFYSVPESLMIWHKDYPPFISLFELFFAKTSGYSEAIITMAMHIYMLGAIVPYFVDKVKKRSVAVWAPVAMVSVILMLDSYGIFKTIQGDLLIAVQAALPLMVIFLEQGAREKKDERRRTELYRKIIISLCMVTLVLTKQIGLPLAAMVMVYYMVDEVLAKRGRLRERKWWLSCMAMVAVSAVMFVVWSIYTAALNTGAQFSLGNINIGEYLGIVLRGEGAEYKLTGNALFWQYLWTEPVLVKPFGLGYLPCYFVVMAILTLIWLTNRKEFSRGRFVTLLVIFTCGTVGYMMTMSVLYMFCFSEGETVALACFGRYMSSYALMEVLMLIGLAIYYWSLKPHFAVKSAALCTVLVLCVNSGFRCLLPQRYLGEEYLEYNTEFREIAERVNEATEEGAKVLVVMDDYSCGYLLQYFLDGRPVTCRNQGYFDGEVEEVEQFVTTQDYIYLDEVPEGFSKKYGGSLADPIREQTLYKIEEKIVEVQR